MNSDVGYDEFIKNNILDWSFAGIILSYKSANAADSKVLYYLKYSDSNIASERFGCNNACFLCVDGKFRILEKCNKDVFYASSKEEICAIQNQCNEFIIDICRKMKLKNDGFYRLPYIDFIKGNLKPNHLFTLEEIYELMLNADDRMNNTLVINENGEAEIVTGLFSFPYPVRLETWIAGNKYVGNNNVLPEAKSAYIRALNGWLSYLKTGLCYYIDFTNISDEDYLLSEIKKISN